MESHSVEELKEVAFIFIEEYFLEDWIGEYLEEAWLYLFQMWKLQNNWSRRYRDGIGDRPPSYVELDGFVENEEECYYYCWHSHRDWHVEVDVEATVDLVRPIAAIFVRVAEQAICKAAAFARVTHPPKRGHSVILEGIPLFLWNMDPCNLLVIILDKGISYVADSIAVFFIWLVVALGKSVTAQNILDASTAIFAPPNIRLVAKKDSSETFQEIFIWDSDFQEVDTCSCNAPVIHRSHLHSLWFHYREKIPVLLPNLHWWSETHLDTWAVCLKSDISLIHSCIIGRQAWINRQIEQTRSWRRSMMLVSDWLWFLRSTGGRTAFSVGL